MTEKQKYFIKQKLIGVMLIGIGIVSTLMLFGEDFPILIILGPIGLYTMFTKRMIWMDEYYFRIKESEKGRSGD